MKGNVQFMIADRIEELSEPLNGAIAILNDVTTTIEEKSKAKGIVSECNKLYSLVYLLDHVYNDLSEFAKELIVEGKETA